jgi:outer membrane PBP1 activator LpoA protein
LVRAALRETDLGAARSAARRHVVVIGDGALARRAGAAFVAALSAAAEPVITLDYAPHGVAGIAREIAKAPATTIFLALDIREAVQVRPRLPIDAPLFATSQLNLAGVSSAAAANDLEGVRFLDMPWLVDPDRPALQPYRRAVAAYNAELQRLYALGIDAYRIGIEWLNGRTRFELDGATGWLRIDRERGAKVERTPALAVFREGRVERSDVVR